MLDPFIGGIVTPPPVMPVQATVSSASGITSQALQTSIYRRIPHAVQNALPTRLKNAVLHPTHFQMAYTLEVSMDNKYSAQRQIVVQDYQDARVIFKISMGDLCALVFELEKGMSGYHNKLTTGLRTLGAIQRLDFMDAATLYATGMTPPFYATTASSTVTSPTAAATAVSSSLSDMNNNTSSSSSSYNCNNNCNRNFSYLIVQLTSRIIILNIKQGSNAHALDAMLRLKANSTARSLAYKPIVAHIGETHLKSLPTTIAVPISFNLLLIGCADGCVKVYNIRLEKVMSTQRGPADKNVALWYLMPCNPYNNTTITSSDKTKAQPKNLVVRVLSISKKATAYLWELVLSPNADDAADDVLEVKLPICRMDGAFSTPPSAAPSSSDTKPPASSTNSTAANMGSASNATNAGTTATAGASTASSSSQIASDEEWDQYSFIHFEAHRQFFQWVIPHGYKGSRTPTVLLWDLTLSSSIKKKGGENRVPKQEPYVISCSTPSVVAVVPGWLHPNVSTRLLTCALITNTGELHVEMAQLSDGSASASTASTTKSPKTMIWQSTSVSSLLQKEVGAMAPPMMRVTALLTHRRLDPTSLVVISNLGICQVGFTDHMVGARHAHLSTSVVGSEWGKAAITIHHSASLKWEPLDLEDKNRTGRVWPKSSQIIYTSSMGVGATATATSTTSKQQQLQAAKPLSLFPPRIFPSPSGKFICLYWSSEMRYEILHVISSLQRKSAESPAPAVASGTRVLDVAWVGDEDVFALLHPPMESKTTEAAPALPISAAEKVISGSMSVGSAAVKFGKKFNIGRSKDTQSVVSTTTSKSDENGNPTTFATDASRFQPRVELKILVGVTANAVELGSIAAATARSLGTIPLRGGNRHAPTALYGGPNLCVASKDNKKADGGAAQFYALKPGSDEQNASNFIQTGPTLPCPDYCQWDDDGTLCAIVVQGLVVIYLSRKDQFVLLGNVRLGAPRERHVTVTGLKFLHGVLYCTTRTTVQCIFLGDLTRDGICHLDTYILASAEGPNSTGSNSMTPPTVAMTLNHPSVLGYQSGSLLVSTVTGLFAISLEHPLLRIGTLLAAGQHARAKRWFAAISDMDHEVLANFLDRRGCADLALDGSMALSLETMVELTLRHGLVDHLEDLVRTYGVAGLRRLGRGVSVGILGPEEHGHSLIVSIGAYLLSQGRLGMVHQIVRECLLPMNDAKDALVLASLLLAVDPTEPRKMLQSAVGEKEEEKEIVLGTTTIPISNDNSNVGGIDPAFSNEYPVSDFIRDFIL